MTRDCLKSTRISPLTHRLFTRVEIKCTGRKKNNNPVQIYVQARSRFFNFFYPFTSGWAGLEGGRVSAVHRLLTTTTWCKSSTWHETYRKHAIVIIYYGIVLAGLRVRTIKVCGTDDVFTNFFTISAHFPSKTWERFDHSTPARAQRLTPLSPHTEVMSGFCPCKWDMRVAKG